MLVPAVYILYWYTGMHRYVVACINCLVRLFLKGGRKSPTRQRAKTRTTLTTSDVAVGGVVIVAT